MEKLWYVVNTYSGHEYKVKEKLESKIESMGLQDNIFRIVIPETTEVEVKDGVQKEHKKKMFPGYILVEMNMSDESWYIVRNTRGCAGFVGPEGKPVALTEEEVAALGVEKVSVEVQYEVGDMVTVIDGPLEGFSGTVESIDTANNSVQVIVSMFGRETAVDFELDQLEKVKD